MRTQLKKDETLLLIARQHWMTLVIPFLAWLIIVVLLFNFFDAPVALMIALGLLAVPGYLYMEWKYNLWVVTNMRVIDESGFFTRHTKESPLEKINNVEFDQSVWGRMMGYGDVEIQTAAEMGDSTNRMIRDPKLLKDTLTQAQESYKSSQVKNQAQELAFAIRESMHPGGSGLNVADEISKLFDLLQKGAITQAEYSSQKNKLLK